MTTEPPDARESPTPPDELVAIQGAFARAISTPFEFASVGDDYGVRIDAYDERIAREMVARPPTSGVERLATYNRQFWYRLFTVLQEEFPLFVRLVGYSRLNQIASAYLTAVPSSSPLLQRLALRFVEFLESDRSLLARQCDDDEVLLDAARLDLIYVRAFSVASLPSLDDDAIGRIGEGRLLGEPLSFQPHWFLFREEVSLVETRRKAKENAADRALDRVALARRPGYWAIWRGALGLREEQLDPIAYRLLERLRDGVPLDAACAAVENELSDEAWREVENVVGDWFARWRALGFFAAPDAR